MPVLVGLRYFIWKSFYITGEAGVSIRMGHNTGTHLTLAPAAGYIIPIKKSHIDLGIKLMNVVEGGGIPESTSLQRGGYGYWTFRIAY